MKEICNSLRTVIQYIAIAVLCRPTANGPKHVQLQWT